VVTLDEGEATDLPEVYRHSGLVTNTLVASASDALTHSIDVTLRHFLDLSSLLESSVLLDNLQVLPSSDNLPKSPLTNVLWKEGILTELTPIFTRRRLSREILGLPRELFERLNMSPGESLVDVEAVRGSFVGMDRKVDGHDRRLDEVGAYVGIDYTRDLDGLLAQIDQVATFPSLNRESVRTRIYRSNAYLVLAAMHHLDYFPDFERVPFTAGILRDLYQSLPTQVYERISAALDEPVSVGQLSRQWRLDGTIPIPPITSIVLDRANTLAEVPEILLEVRSEFASFRRDFRLLKTKLETAPTVREHQREVQKQKALLEVASGTQREFVSIGNMLSLGENLVNVVAAPASPTSYASSLIIQPIDWIRRWWLRRPLAVLFRMDSKLPRLADYRLLIEKHWGRRIDDELLKQYVKHAHDIRRLLDTE
jgi:hypothetical protein